MSASRNRIVSIAVTARNTAWILAFQALFVCALALASAHAQPTLQNDTRRSGFEFMSPQTQALQRDDAQNPAMLWVEDGRARWSSKPANGKSCADCHGVVETSMKGVAARYPKYVASGKRVRNLAQQINACHTTRQQQPALAAESDALLALEALIAQKSRNLPITPVMSAPLRAAQVRGEKIFNQRMGQIDLSCRDCHDSHAGKRLAATNIPQGHPTAYPIYRLEWQTVGTLQRRLRGCMVAVRAEPFAPNSDEFIALEAYLMQRARGMTIESPGVRP